MRHIPVLKNEIFENLPKKLNYYVDGTTWHAWHIQYILDNYKNTNPNKINIICFDIDSIILEKAKDYLRNYTNKFFFINKSYSELSNSLSNIWIDKVDYILLDLWVNLEHFKDKSRWFSIKYNEKLDMRYDTNQSLTAKILIDTYSEEDLHKIFINYWDFSENFSQKMAQEIIKNNKNINTTYELKDILRTLRLNEKKIAVVFQCIRIEVNNELKKLEQFLKNFDKHLNKWWRCAIITYHSIEDRIVKYKFKELTNQNFVLVNKHVIQPNYQETLQNPASRSAKLRIIEAL